LPALRPQGSSLREAQPELLIQLGPPVAWYRSYRACSCESANSAAGAASSSMRAWAPSKANNAAKSTTTTIVIFITFVLSGRIVCV
jgi:hypothetical protein